MSSGDDRVVILLRKMLNFDMVDDVCPDEADFTWGRLAEASNESRLEEKSSSVVPTSWTGSSFSFCGEGTSPIFTGADDPPSNQAARPADLLFVGDCDRPWIVDSSASTDGTLSGDSERVLPGRRNEKAEDRVGEKDCVRVKSGGRSTAVLDR
jgi:hypothetical protein